MDVHRLEIGLPLWIGGLKIGHEKGFVAHSDGDVLIHAMCDALLGAAGLGDIGYHFPDSSSEYKGIDSKILLERTVKMIRKKGYEIGNIDATIIAQKPKMRDYIDTMRKNVADTLGIELDQVNIKATTEEGLGFTGSGEGISSQAICSISSYYEHMVNNAPAGCASCGGCARN